MVDVRRPAPRHDRPARIVLCSHDTLGYGHLRRDILIAAALAELEPRPGIVLIGGMREAGALALPAGVDCATLPAHAEQSDGSDRPRDPGGDLARLAALRAGMIHGASRSCAPSGSPRAGSPRCPCRAR